MMGNSLRKTRQQILILSQQAAIKTLPVRVKVKKTIIVTIPCIILPVASTSITGETRTVSGMDLRGKQLLDKVIGS